MTWEGMMKLPRRRQFLHLAAGAAALSTFPSIARAQAYPTRPMTMVARKGVPANDLKDLIAWLKANSAKATQGTAGHGSGSHVSGVFFQHLTGTRFQFVPYRGAGPAMQDLVAGQIDLMIDQAGNS